MTKHLKIRPWADIGDRIKWHRDLEGFTVDEYAKRANLTRQQVTNWETGASRLSLDGALALRQTYGLSLDFLFEGIAEALSMTLRKAWMERPAVSDSRKSMVKPDA